MWCVRGACHANIVNIEAKKFLWKNWRIVGIIKIAWD